MKENMQKVIDKIKEFGGKIKAAFDKIDTSKVKKAWSDLKDKLRKIGFLKAIVHFVRAHRLVISISCFSITFLALVLGAVWGLHEYIVPVCVLMVIEVVMAVLLHRAELWIHGLLLVAQLVVAIVMGRLPLVILCMLAYVAATITMQFAYEQPKKEVKEEPKQETKKESEESESDDDEEDDEDDEKDDDDEEEKEDNVEDLNDPEERHEEAKSSSNHKSKNKKKNKKKK